MKLLSFNIRLGRTEGKILRHPTEQSADADIFCFLEVFNRVSWEKFKIKQHFADFTFVSPEVKAKDFILPYNEVSDHWPMILKFGL